MEKRLIILQSFNQTICKKIRKNKITFNIKTSENMPNLEVTEVVLTYLILLATIINKIQESCMLLVLINHLVNY